MWKMSTVAVNFKNQQINNEIMIKMHLSPVHGWWVTFRERSWFYGNTFYKITYHLEQTASCPLILCLMIRMGKTEITPASSVPFFCSVIGAEKQKWWSAGSTPRRTQTHPMDPPKLVWTEPNLGKTLRNRIVRKSLLHCYYRISHTCSRREAKEKMEALGNFKFPRVSQSWKQSVQCFTTKYPYKGNTEELTFPPSSPF